MLCSVCYSIWKEFCRAELGQLRVYATHSVPLQSWVGPSRNTFGLSPHPNCRHSNALPLEDALKGKWVRSEIMTAMNCVLCSCCLLFSLALNIIDNSRLLMKPSYSGIKSL